MPGVSATLSAPDFQRGGWGEAQGALWQLLTAHLPAPQAGSHRKAVPGTMPGGGQACPELRQKKALENGSKKGLPAAQGYACGKGEQQPAGGLLLEALLEDGMRCCGLPQVRM